MCMLTTSIKLTLKVFLYDLLSLHFGMWLFKELPFFCSSVFLNRLAKDFSVSFFFFFDCCSRGTWTVSKMLHWAIRKKLEYRFYYFLCVGVTYHVYFRKIAKARKQRYKITLDLCSSVQVTFRCVCAWNEIGLKMCIV